MYQTYFLISSSVKGQLILSFMEWCGAYFLRQICMNSCPGEGGSFKKVWTPLGVNICGTTLEGDQRFFRHLTELLASPDIPPN